MKLSLSAWASVLLGAFAAAAAEPSGDFVVIPNVSIGKLKLGEPRADVLLAMGPPAETHSFGDGSGDVDVWGKARKVWVFSRPQKSGKEVVTTITVNSPSFKTAVTGLSSASSPLEFALACDETPSRTVFKLADGRAGFSLTCGDQGITYDAVFAANQEPAGYALSVHARGTPPEVDRADRPMLATPPDLTLALPAPCAGETALSAAAQKNVESYKAAFAQDRLAALLLAATGQQPASCALKPDGPVQLVFTVQFADGTSVINTVDTESVRFGHPVKSASVDALLDGLLEDTTERNCALGAAGTSFAGKAKTVRIPLNNVAQTSQAGSDKGYGLPKYCDDNFKVTETFGDKANVLGLSIWSLSASPSGQ